jgi:hypothetical protein
MGSAGLELDVSPEANEPRHGSRNAIRAVRPREPVACTFFAFSNE